jgi:hypothetical protein
MMAPLRGLFARLWRGREGASALEFAFVVPPLMLILIGIMELAMIGFATSVLEGGLREAARFGITGLQPGNGTREQHIVNIINEHGADLVTIDTNNIATLVYQDFGSIGDPEPYVDLDGSGAYDGGEPFTDVNCNGAWDEDMGRAGLGAGGDVVIYQVNYDWPLLTGLLAPFIGTDGKVPLGASVAVRNEPYEGGAAGC